MLSRLMNDSDQEQVWVQSRTGMEKISQNQSMNELTRPRTWPQWVAFWVATVLGVGLLPLAPGTWGSAIAVAVFPLLSQLGVEWLLGGILLSGLLGTWAANYSPSLFGSEDDGRIVIDEVSGQWLALLPLFFLDQFSNSLWLVTGFVLFRCFDIRKPGPVRWAERSGRGGLSVMADDWVAGFLAAILLTGFVLASNWVRS